MGKFLNGLFVGIGIGLFIAPQKGKETRRLLRESVAALGKGMSSADDQHLSINAFPSQMTTLPVEPAQPIAMSFSEPEREDTITIPLAETPPGLSTQNAIATDDNQTTTDTEQTASSVTNPPSAPDTRPTERTSEETPITEAENRATSPHLSTPPSRTGRRKTSTRTPNTGKTRGYDRS